MNMEEDAVKWLSGLFTYPRVDISEGLEYFGFIINPNGYTRRDWGGFLVRWRRG